MSIYLVGQNLPVEPAGERFAQLVRRGGIVRMPGAYNGLAALQAKRQGFEALYLSGAAVSASMGLPDLGIITVEDVCFHHPAGQPRRGAAATGGWRHGLR